MARRLRSTGWLAATVILLGLLLAGSTRTMGQAANTLIIYTARDRAIFDYVVAKFEERYPEFRGNVQVLNMGAQQVLERIRAEKVNAQADIWWGGTQQAFQLASQEDLLQTINPPFASQIPAQDKAPNGTWFGEMLLPEMIMYNTQALKPNEAPQDWDDLIDPKWKGKIIIRAVAPSGTMHTIFDAMIARFFKTDGNPNRGYDWLRKLDANTKEYAADPTTLYLKIARQEGLVTVWDLQDILIQQEKQGLPFGYVMPKSGAPVLVDGVAEVKGAKHPQAAERFLELLFSSEVRFALTAAYYQIPTIPLGSMPQPAWLKNLSLKAMDLPWDVMATHDREWIQYWDQNIKGKGGR
ncbi:MAG TPA: extracellular solute-binding protein [bacterium]|nr:extracellular solute-binding protein [bacterium]